MIEGVNMYILSKFQEDRTSASTFFLFKYAKEVVPQDCPQIYFNVFKVLRAQYCIFSKTKKLGIYRDIDASTYQVSER